MHTPDQARELWCPMVRGARLEPVQVVQADGTLKTSEVALSQVSGCNTDALGSNRVPASCRCIADKCAMWRWAEYDTKQEQKVEEVGSLRRVVTESIKVPVAGYCGLAGRPV